MNTKLLIQNMLFATLFRQVHWHRNLEAYIFKIYLKIFFIIPPFFDKWQLSTSFPH